MRKIDPGNFNVARRRTTREVNRRILLTLLAARQPISRAELSRLMETSRASITLIVNEMIAEGLIHEGPVGQIARGRKPKLLQINARQSCVVAVDIRPTTTFITLTDLLGNQITDLESWPTERAFRPFVQRLTRRVKKLVARADRSVQCKGVGVVVPGIVDADGHVVFAPHLGWHDVPLGEALASRLGLPVRIENSGRACALAQVWVNQGEANPARNLVYVSVSDGIGVGVVVNGELVRGHRDSAGQFAHVPLSVDGPRCSCGATGCWEAYVSNLATLERYWGPTDAAAGVAGGRTVPDLVARARAGDARALAALLATGRYLGLGFGSILSAFDPACIYVGGEVTAAWDLIGEVVTQALGERNVGHDLPRDFIRVVSSKDQPRLRGAAALINAPAFAALRVG
jgi:N-acetylglucosamine repressor